MEILYKDRSIYDGWCAKYDTETGEVILRDHWAINRLSDERKQELIENIKNQFSHE